MPLYPPPGNPTRQLGSVSGPSSYPTGGFVVDLRAVFASVEFFDVAVEAVGLLPPCRFEITRNSPTPGQVTIKVFRIRYDKVNATSGQAQNPPSGVAVRNASGTNAAGVDAIAGTGTAHTVNQLYDHNHALATTQTDTANVEIAAGFNLSATTLRYNAIGT